MGNFIADLIVLNFGYYPADIVVGSLTHH